MSRPRPVLIFAAVIAALNALAAIGDLTDVLPSSAVKWIAIGSAVVTAVGGVIVQGQVTPLSSPRDKVGTRLVPYVRAQRRDV